MPVVITHAHASKANTPGRIYDTHPGLHLWVKSPTRKYWVFRCSKGGRGRTDYSLGVFPKVGVSEARQKASALARVIESGGDLTPRRARSRQINEVAEEPRFRDFAMSVVAAKRPEWRNEKHAAQWIYTLTEFAFPTIGDKALSDITTEDILRVLQPIWSSKTETATRLRGRLERILSAATIRGLRFGVNPAQWRGHLDCLLPMPQKLKKVRHHPALPYAEVPAFIQKLQGKSSVSALALEFCILTASRTGEVLNAKRGELLDAIWTIPAERMKAWREHAVPLTKRAIQIVQIARVQDPNSDFIFSSHGKPLSNMALRMLLRRMGYEHVTTHGFRSSFRDWVAEETDFSPEVAEMCLAHTIGNKTEAAYRRGNLIEKRRRLLEAWERYSLGEPESVLVLRAA